MSTCTLSEPLSKAETPAHVSKSSFYRPELDVLRFFAFFTVFMTHAMPHSTDYYSGHFHLPKTAALFVANFVGSGGTGVVLFFMLSSYLITGLLIREHEKTGRMNIRAFYIRRALRIWPLYFSFLIGSFFIFPRLLGFPQTPGLHQIGLLTFTENWVVFFSGQVKNSASHLWSVAVEEQFYLVWPILIAAAGIARMRSITVICVLGAELARALMLRQNPEAHLWFPTTSHIDAIAIGALIAWLFRDGPPQINVAARTIMAGGAILIPGLIGVIDGTWGALVRYPANVFACAMILLAALAWQSRRSMQMDALIYLGKISYGLYVFHTVFIWILENHKTPVMTLVPIAFIATVLAAAASYHWLELPFLRLKERFSVVASRAP